MTDTTNGLGCRGTSTSTPSTPGNRWFRGRLRIQSVSTCCVCKLDRKLRVCLQYFASDNDFQKHTLPYFSSLLSKAPQSIQHHTVLKRSPARNLPAVLAILINPLVWMPPLLKLGRENIQTISFIYFLFFILISSYISFQTFLFSFFILHPSSLPKSSHWFRKPPAQRLEHRNLSVRGRCWFHDA